MKVFINEDYRTGSVEIYLKDQEKGKEIFYQWDGRNISALETDISTAGEIINPFIKLPFGFFDILLKALTEEGQKRGIQTENENHLKGKLEATEKHLEDTRAAFHKLLESYHSPILEKCLIGPEIDFEHLRNLKRGE